MTARRSLSRVRHPAPMFCMSLSSIWKKGRYAHVILGTQYAGVKGFEDFDLAGKKSQKGRVYGE